MQSSSLTTKGQVTIPSDIRRQLGLHPGDQVGFYVEDGHVILFRKENDIKAAFGVVHPKKSVGIDEMQEVIRKRGRDAGR